MFIISICFAPSHFYFEWDAERPLCIRIWASCIVVLSWHLYSEYEPGSRAHWHLHTSVFKGRYLVVWFSQFEMTHTLLCFLSLIDKESCNIAERRMFYSNDSMNASLWDVPRSTMMISEIWRPAIIPFDDLYIRVSARHVDILVRMFHLWRILAHCNNLLLFVNTMLFIWSLS